MKLKKRESLIWQILTTTKVREILKKIRLNKYYEHVPHIINRLNGLPAPIMTRETEEKLRSMFKEIKYHLLNTVLKKGKTSYHTLTCYISLFNYWDTIII